MQQTLNQLATELNITQSFSKILIALGCVMLVMFILITVLDVMTIRKRISDYITRFKSLYFESHDVKDTMQKMSEMYKPNSKEAKALKAGVYYLEHNMIKDYRNALDFIDSVFDNKEVHAMHLEVIEDAAKSKVFLIENKSEA